MSGLRQAVDDYLELRRGLGFKLRRDGMMLPQFVAFLERRGARYVTARLAVEWAIQAHSGKAHWAARLGIVRGFARFRSATDPRTEIPAKRLLPFRHRRRPPHIFSDRDVGRLLKAARRLPSPSGLRPATYSTLFALLSVTGMRIGEAIRLDRSDVDLEQGVLLIRETKFGKTRIVPLHASVRRALRRYSELRDRCCRHPHGHAFLLSEHGERLNESTVDWTFQRLVQKVGIPNAGGKGSLHPRLHDFRHTMAVNTLLSWYRSGANVDAQMPVLSTYLGHGRVEDTFWYVSAVPELLRLASDRVAAARRRPP